jgi:putative transposase
MAVKNQPLFGELIFHSGQGILYACLAFAQLLESYKFVRRNISRKENFWDDEVAKTALKNEDILL